VLLKMVVGDYLLPLCRHDKLFCHCYPWHKLSLMTLVSYGHLGEIVQHFQCHIHLDQQVMSLQTLSDPLQLKGNSVHRFVPAAAKEN